MDKNEPPYDRAEAHGPGCPGCVGPDCTVCDAKVLGFEYNPMFITVPAEIEPMWPGGPAVAVSTRPHAVPTPQDYTVLPCRHHVPRESLVWTHPAGEAAWSTTPGI